VEPPEGSLRGDGGRRRGGPAGFRSARRRRRPRSPVPLSAVRLRPVPGYGRRHGRQAERDRRSSAAGAVAALVALVAITLAPRGARALPGRDRLGPSEAAVLTAFESERPCLMPAPQPPSDQGSGRWFVAYRVPKQVGAQQARGPRDPCQIHRRECWAAGFAELTRPLTLDLGQAPSGSGPARSARVGHARLGSGARSARVGHARLGSGARSARVGHARAGHARLGSGTLGSGAVGSAQASRAAAIAAWPNAIPPSPGGS
jgi:hypothetical protein